MYLLYSVTLTMRPVGRYLYLLNNLVKTSCHKCHDVGNERHTTQFNSPLLIAELPLCLG